MLNIFNRNKKAIALETVKREDESPAELHSFKRPTEPTNLTTKMSEHRSGEFLYASVYYKNHEKKNALLAKLRNMTKRVSTTPLQVENIPPLTLYEEVTTIRFTDIFGKSLRPDKWYRISNVEMLFTPASSATSDYTIGMAAIYDESIIGFRRIGAIKFNTNTQSGVSFNCDYSRTGSSYKHVVFRVEIPHRITIPGTEWGQIQVVIEIEMSDAAFIGPKKKVLPHVMLTEAMLADPKEDPTLADVSYDHAGREMFRKMVKRGLITDRSGFQAKTFHATKSEAGSVGEEHEEEEEESRPNIASYLASINRNREALLTGNESEPGPSQTKRIRSPPPRAAVLSDSSYNSSPKVLPSKKGKEKFVGFSKDDEVIEPEELGSISSYDLELPSHAS